ncbi:Phenazine biosynthesis PhzF protein [Dioscorea alata]|uniref:Phenazine biosynthesis PhzF protein n=1 Tax=Dioscorea alata TaxID=55571 RepID=A0ACB7VRK4_DIOAL|nr:Phenazine biosynthesis PhzF protein [Dioscorea alata]
MFEVDLCGHATLAAAHFLLSYGLVKCDVIEFATKSGILTATKVYGIKQSTLFNVKDENFIKSNGEKESFSIELNFPVCKVVESDPGEIPSIPETLNGASVINVTKRGSSDDHIVEVASGLDVVNLKPKFDEIRNCAGIGVIVTGPAPPGSGYDIFSRYFCPKLGLDEASPRGGRLDLTLDENAERVYIISFRFSLSPAFFFLYFRRQNMLFDEPCRNLV